MGEARTYPVVVRGLEAGEAGPGFFVHCPVMPGVLSEGATREEALANIREAISLALENRAKEGWEVAELVMGDSRGERLMGEARKKRRARRYSSQTMKEEQGQHNSRLCERLAAHRQGADDFDGDPSWVEGDKPLSHNPIASVAARLKKPAGNT